MIDWRSMAWAIARRTSGSPNSLFVRSSWKWYSWIVSLTVTSTPSMPSASSIC